MPEETTVVTGPEVLGTEALPYDPDNPLHEDMIDKASVKAEADEAENNEESTLKDVFIALRELTKTVGSLAKEQKGMRERHDKWIKAGKF